MVRRMNRHASDSREKGKGKPLPELIKSITKMPAISPSVLRLVEFMQQPERTIPDMVAIIETDTALTANLLRLINSPAMGLRQPVTSLIRAAAMLGDKTILALALESAQPGLYTSALPGYEGRPGDLWRHSLHTAMAARELTPRLVGGNDATPELAFTAGILHDLGKVVLSRFLDGETAELLFGIDAEEHANFLDAERSILGIDHPEAGALLAEHWRLPTVYAKAIRWHHAPAQADDESKPLCYLIHLADHLAMLNGAATGADALQYPLDEDFDRYIKFSESDMDQLLDALALEFETARVSLLCQEEN